MQQEALSVYRTGTAIANHSKKLKVCIVIFFIGDVNFKLITARHTFRHCHHVCKFLAEPSCAEKYKLCADTNFFPCRDGKGLLVLL
jgi:hypothetical protein